MAEEVAQNQLLPGDLLDVAYTLDHNDHPEFGGLGLTLRDFRKVERTIASAATKSAKPATASPAEAAIAATQITKLLATGNAAR